MIFTSNFHITSVIPSNKPAQLLPIPAALRKHDLELIMNSLRDRLLIAPLVQILPEKLQTSIKGEMRIILQLLDSGRQLYSVDLTTREA